MKRAVVFVMLAVFLVSFMSSTASAAIIGTWVPSVATTRIGTASRSFSSVIEAIAKFEGTLQAYSVSGDPNVEEQVFLASEGISTSLVSLNAELTAVYSSLGDEEQSALIEVYSSMGSYLEDLADEANQIFLGDQESTPIFAVDNTEEIIFEESPGRLWVGSSAVV